MPWSKDDYPNSMKYFKPSIRNKAIQIANAILKDGGSESVAIATGIKKAKSVHDKKSIVKLAFLIPLSGVVVGANIGNKFGKTQEKKQRNARIGAGVGFLAGIGAEYALLRKMRGGGFHMPQPKKKTDVATFFKEHGHNHTKITTKAQAKKVYRDAAMKYHPDRGGNEEKFKKLSTDWEGVENSGWFNKLAALNNFSKTIFAKQMMKAIKKGDDKFLVDKVEDIKEKVKEPIL